MLASGEARTRIEILQLKLSKIVAFMMKRQFAEAQVEIESAGDPDDPQNLYDSYPKLYPSRSGSLMPFFFRHMKAKLAAKDGNAEPLYALLSLCRQHATNATAGHYALEDSDGVFASSDDSIDSWQAVNSTCKARACVCARAHADDCSASCV